nr:Chaperone protein ClpB [Leptospira interrogans serovar Copenhageni/Icterohaemorrhagiae]
MLQGERAKLLLMEDVLKTKVIGQDHALRLVSEAVQRSRAGIADPNRPIGTFFISWTYWSRKDRNCKSTRRILV